MAETRPKTIGFFTDGPAFDGGALDRHALGGSETALIQMARALAGRGHQVTVLNNCDRPGLFDGVTYLPWRRFPGRITGTWFDVFIVSRYAGFFHLPLAARLRVLWNHDTLDRPAALREVLDRIDLHLVLSRFHRDNFLTRLPELQGRLIVTRNGLDLDLIDRAVRGAAKDPDRVIYASRPERGLKVLLEDLWPRLVEKRPHLMLQLCRYEVDRAGLAQGVAELTEYLDRLADGSRNVVRLGALTKEQYYRRLAGSTLMLYPCTFPEISCLAALEAQACRTPVLTTDGFALAETVKEPEFKVPGRPGSGPYREEFLHRALVLLDQPRRAAELAGRAGDKVRAEHAWMVIAAEWDRLFDLTLASKKAASAARPGGGGGR
ncbi:MAG: glycosyltransferase family 4 protein [Thermodesulfobacteriota bacterium]